MPNQRRLTDKGIERLEARPQRYFHPDPEMAGHYIRVSPSGAKAFAAVARDPRTHKQIWATIGSTEHHKIEESRELAREAIKRIKKGEDPFPPAKPKPSSFGAVADDYVKSYVRGEANLRSADEVERILNKYVLPRWRDREFTSVRRSDVMGLVRQAKRNHGQRQAQYILAVVRGLVFWAAEETEHVGDDYVVPILMRRRRRQRGAGKRAGIRERSLTHDELRTLWPVFEASGAFGALCQTLLLTGQRLGKVAALRWQDLGENGAWEIPAEPGEKHTGGMLVLPPMALDAIRKQRRVEGNPYVFFGSKTGSHIAGFSPRKRELDKAAPQVAHWTLHDLRRTAKSLMREAGVTSFDSERVLGHVIPGVEGVYDQHSYRTEKQRALAALAALVQRILDPDTTTNIVLLRG
jgi:integrase